MDTGALKKFAQSARRQIREQVAAKLDQVLKTDSVEIREQEQAVKELNDQIKKTSQEAVIDKVAYIWFNRFCALRFMDVNRYTRIGAVSPSEGFTQPEILQEAKQGHIDDSLDRFLDRQKVFDLLSGTTPSSDPEQETYRLLLVAVCNFYNSSMPFLFEKIADYTELLMPDDLLSEGSVLTATLEAMTPEACEDVEVIGWLYQFYISEKKDEVFDGLKKNKKITPENIPAATQLFTPHWIVRYLVENSLGRLWMLNRPESSLIEQMEYYIKPEEPETDFLRISSPEEIKICDPACGSGHMLVYAFDLLYAVYEEEGYEPSEISEKILTNNLYGIEIDERAGELAAFALTMKARSKYRRFFRKPVHPQICVLENVQFTEGELKEYMDFVGRDLFTEPFLKTLHQFEEADNFGSLIRPEITDISSMMVLLESKDSAASNLFLSATHQKVLQVFQQANYLSPQYHVVIANPPYMGGKGMNGRMGIWLKDNYEEVKSDLFSAFIVRNTELALPQGQLGFMTPFVWMFISSYEKLRNYLINQKTITSLVQLEYSGFDGATVPICTFTVENAHHPYLRGGYVRLSEFRGSENQGPKTLEAVKNPDCDWFYRASAIDFKKIPGCPIGYWASKKTLYLFGQPSLKSSGEIRQGLLTSDNERFLRRWFEVSNTDCGFGFTREEAKKSDLKWFPINKGGDYRKWYGNLEFLVDWYNDGQALHDTVVKKYPYLKGKSGLVLKKTNPYFDPAVTWTDISSTYFGARLMPKGMLYEKGGSCAYTGELYTLLGYFCSKLSTHFLRILSPTLHFQVGDVSNLPYIESILNERSTTNINKIVGSSKDDWDSFETSWDFTSLSLLHLDYRQPTLKATYQKLRAHWFKMTQETQLLEEENNHIYIEAYGLLKELTPEVQLDEITLNCNPHYRYGSGKTEEKLEALLLADTMKEFISYAVGCMFGRYSLDRPGLILANQGETIQDYLTQIPEPIFSADEDNVIPMLDGDWFIDDISERFRKFLRVTFGDEYYEGNLAFIEKAIGKDLRKYFTRDFYNDHVKRYKKRPIYWLFSSPKGSFNTLIYMHRYRPDTISVILNDYLREFRTKLTARVDHLEQISISASASQSEKTKALKEIEKLNKVITELETWERDVLYPLATQQVEIDLDDGVKINYSKFSKALKKIPGVSK